MKRYILYILALSLLLSGCSWMDGSYHYVTPHRQHTSESQSSVVIAGSYLDLRRALEEMVSAGIENRVISVGSFQDDQLENSMEIASRYVKATYPIGAYAVENIEYELGTSGGVAAVAVTISYRHSTAEIQNIRQTADMDEAKEQIQNALTNYDTNLVLMVDYYQSRDLQQIAQDYAALNPDSVMETPEITFLTYPNAGTKRVLEVKFTYQSSRDTLRTMQEQVERVFASASLYVSHDALEMQKFTQLYAFLMERFPEYQIKTSITPAYSLLNHGVGDSKAFSNVYSRMCRQADLECQSIMGTCNGDPWFWNIVQIDGYYYHVDLLASQAEGSFRILTDKEMDNYVWDYSAYPECTGAPVEIPPEIPEDGADTPDTTEQTEPPLQTDPTDQTESEAVSVPSEDTSVPSET